MGVGTPPQTMHCLLDSGSADLWVPSMACATCENAAHFVADESSTLESVQFQPQTLSYGSGEVQGFVASDRVEIGPLVVDKQSFLIVEESVLPEPRHWDGICGLGWEQLAQVGKPFYKSVEEQGIKPIFTLVPAPRRSARLSIGEVPRNSLQEGTLVWLPAERIRPMGGFLTDKTFWVVNGGLSIRRRDPIPSRFLIDTGTNFILTPSKFYPGFMRSLLPESVFDTNCGQDVSSGNVVFCDCSVATLPEMLPVNIFLGDRKFVLRLPELFKRVPSTDGSDMCLLQIQPNPMTPTGPFDIIRAVLNGNVGLPNDGMPGLPVLDIPVDIPSGVSANPPAVSDAYGGDLAGQTVEEVVETQPDGSLCLTKIVWDADGNEVSREKKCDPSGGRRLDSAGDVSEAAPVDDLWVLGGVFLEHVVTVLDFEQGRVGFAEPALGDDTSQPRMESTQGVMKVEWSSVTEETLDGRTHHHVGFMTATFLWIAWIMGMGAVVVLFWSWNDGPADAQPDGAQMLNSGRPADEDDDDDAAE